MLHDKLFFVNCDKAIFILVRTTNQFDESSILEKSENVDAAVYDLIRNTVKEHKRILFSGNNYSEEWRKEALERGLLELKTTVDALPLYDSEKNIELFEKIKVLSAGEIRSRKEILLENYANAVHIEALTAVDMARKEITPAIIGYESFLIDELNKKKALSADIECGLESDLIKKISKLSEKYNKKLNALVKHSADFGKYVGNYEKAKFCKDVLVKDLDALREVADEMELITGKSFNEVPSYEDLLYSVKY